MKNNKPANEAVAGGRKLTYQEAKKKVDKTRYAKRVEHQCDGALDSEGVCIKCGRILLKKGRHNPNQTGSLGYDYTWSDGSTFSSSDEATNL